MYPTIYEINTRVWIKKFGNKIKLSQIPHSYWLDLRNKGVEYIWLMGVWQTTPSSIEKYCFDPGLIRSYDKVSNHWRREDISGSPYAIEDYELSAILGDSGDLQELKRQINSVGLKLILDFVPNHFNAESHLLETNPEIFLNVTENLYEQDRFTYFQRGNLYFAHGKDPYFPAWTDTVQINYFSPSAHAFMKERLLSLLTYCDGVRCDMAMLVLPDIFEKTWGYCRDQRYDRDFWLDVIPEIKAKNQDFIFIAEAYWDTQWRLQEMGFDFTYDKKLLDLIQRDQTTELKAHLTGTMAYQNRTVRFIENHDEERSLTSLGQEKAKVAALLYQTLPGMRLHYDGQWTGERIRYPVQLGTYFSADLCPCVVRNYLIDGESPCSCIKVYYDKLLEVTKDTIFKKGTWQLLPTYPDNNTCIIMSWSMDSRILVVAINLGQEISHIYTHIPQQWERAPLHDLLNSLDHPSYVEYVDQNLLIRLPPLKGCILSV